MVNRILLESLGVAAVDPQTTPVATVLDPPASLDMAPMFADDGIIAGPSEEVRRALAHLRVLMPSLGLRFSRLEVTTAAGEAHNVHLDAFRDLGCTINLTQCLEIMKAPTGSRQFCEEVASKRVRKATHIVQAIAEVPDEHCAFHMLRYQAGRLAYLTRTTPSQDIRGALQSFDAALKTGLEHITGFTLSDSQFQQASLPSRHAGIESVRSVVATADAAYFASRAATWKRCQAIYSRVAQPNDPLHGVANHLRSQMDSDTHEKLVMPEGEEDIPVRQQTLALAVAKKAAEDLQNRSAPLDRARMIAYSAPGAGRWHAVVPSRTLDKHLTSSQLRTLLAMQLGVDVHEGNLLCRCCGSALGTKGIHDISCTCGGDFIERHNKVRDLIYAYALRGMLHPLLERAGLLDDPNIMVDLRRPADVLIQEGAGEITRSALDVKIINALGPDHFTATLSGSLTAAEAYREQAMAHQNTADLCAAQGIAYEPLVFTCQGGCERHAEAILTRMAGCIAKCEGGDAARIKAEMMEDISYCIGRSVAQSVLKRGTTARSRQTLVHRALEEAAKSQDDMEE